MKGKSSKMSSRLQLMIYRSLFACIYHHRFTGYIPSESTYAFVTNRDLVGMQTHGPERKLQP
jgi:hypothetical protein